MAAVSQSQQMLLLAYRPSAGQQQHQHQQPAHWDNNTNNSRASSSSTITTTAMWWARTCTRCVTSTVLQLPAHLATPTTAEALRQQVQVQEQAMSTAVVLQQAPRVLLQGPARGAQEGWALWERPLLCSHEPCTWAVFVRTWVFFWGGSVLPELGVTHL